MARIIQLLLISSEVKININDPMDRIENLYAKIYFDYNNSDNYVCWLFRGDNGVVFKS